MITAHNRRLAKKRVQCLNGALCFVSGAVLANSLMLPRLPAGGEIRFFAKRQTVIRYFKYRQMKIKQWSIFMLVLSGLLTSCVDLFPNRHKIDGPYFVESDPGAAYETLYFELGDGNAIARIENVKKVGHTDKFIIAETQEGYHFIDRQKDNRYLNGNEIVGDLKTHDYFIKWLDSLKIKDFKFDYYLEK